VRGVKKGALEIINSYHPHLDPPPSRGRKKFEFPDENELKAKETAHLKRTVISEVLTGLDRETHVYFNSVNFEWHM
jgi:hypothetical protein